MRLAAKMAPLPGIAPIYSLGILISDGVIAIKGFNAKMRRRVQRFTIAQKEPAIAIQL